MCSYASELAELTVLRAPGVLGKKSRERGEKVFVGVRPGLSSCATTVAMKHQHLQIHLGTVQIWAILFLIKSEIANNRTTYFGYSCR